MNSSVRLGSLTSYSDTLPLDMIAPTAATPRPEPLATICFQPNWAVSPASMMTGRLGSARLNVLYPSIHTVYATCAPTKRRCRALEVPGDAAEPVMASV